MVEHLLAAPPERAPEWVHRAWERIESGDSITGAARALRKHPASLRYWIVEGEAERQTAKFKQWAKDNPEQIRKLGRENQAARRARIPEEIRRKHRAYNCRPERRGKCIECGGLMGIDSRPGSKGRCEKCRARERQRTDGKIVHLWKEGASIKEIAAKLGITPGSLGLRMHRMRRRGADLPLRRKPRDH